MLGTPGICGLSWCMSSLLGAFANGLNRQQGRNRRGEDIQKSELISSKNFCMPRFDRREPKISKKRFNDSEDSLTGIYI